MSRTLIIGDIHGCYNELMQLLNEAKIEPEDTIISLGDFVDRGPDSFKVYQFLRERPNTISLMGNHERKHLRGILSYAQEIVKIQFGKDYPEFLNWLKARPYYHKTDQFLVVHAFFEHNILIEHQREDILAGTTAGSRYLEALYGEKGWQHHYRGELPMIYGHHVTGDDPLVINNTYGIDTGACHGGYLTAIEFPGEIFHRVKVESDHWKQQQSEWQLPVLQHQSWHTMSFDQIRKKVNSLRYKEEQDVQLFLDQLIAEIESLQNLFPEIITAIETLAGDLKKKYGDQFNRHMAQYPFRNFIFKASKNRLKIDDLTRSLTTPEQVLKLVSALKIDAGFDTDQVLQNV